MRKAPLEMTYPQYVLIIVILAVLFLYCTFQACNRQCGKFFKDCIRCCCLEDDRQNSERNSIPMNNLSPRPTPQVPAIVINRPNPKERESTPMYSMPRRMLPSSNRLQPLESKIPASIPQGKGENKSSNANVSYSGAKCEPSSINTKTSRRSESHVDFNNNNFVDRVGNRRDGQINQGKHSLERNVTTATQKDDPKPKIRQESQIKKNETPCTLKTSATGNPLNLGNNKSSENNEEPYYQNISGKPITRATTCNTSQGKLENRRIRGDSPVPNIKRRATNERRKQHLSRYIAQNDIGENLWPNYKKAKPFVSYNNQEQLLQKGALCDCYRGPILKGIAKKGSLKLKPLPELEMVNFSEDNVEKNVEQSGSKEVMNPSVPYSGILSRQTKASVSKLNGERSMTSKRQTAAAGTEENLQLKFIKNYINPSKPRRNEEAMNPSVLCCGDLGCKTKAPLWNLKGERSIASKGEIAAGGTEDGLQFIIMNDTNPSKPQGNEETMDPSVQCRGDLGCKTKTPLWNLNGGRSINRKGEITAGGTKENSQFKFIKNDIKTSKPQGNEETTKNSVLCGRDLCYKTKAPLWNLKGERSINRKAEIAAGGTKENSQFKFIKNDIKTSKPQGNDETTKNSVLWGGDLCCKTKAPLWNLKGERSVTSKGEIAAGGTEDGLQFIIMNDTNPSKPQGNEEAMDPSVQCRGDLGCKTKAPLWNLNGGRSINRKGEIAAGGTKENSQFKFIRNDIMTSKPQGNEETTKNSVLCGGDLCCKTKAPLWNLKGERSVTSKGEIAAGGTEDGLQFIIKNDTNPSKPQNNEEGTNPSVQCRGDLGCKTKAPLWNLNGGKSITRKRQIAVGSTKENSHFKVIKNDIKPSKPQGNEETINPSVLCGGDLRCKTKAPLWNLTGERSITSKGEIAAGGTEDGLQFIIRNDTNPSKHQGNGMVKGTTVKLPSVPLKRKQCTGIMIENTYSGRDIESKNAKVNCSSKIKNYDINSSILHDNEMAKSMALKLPCLSLKRKQFIGNNNETESSGSDTVPKYANDICNLKKKCNFIKNEMGFTRIPAEEKKDNISQRFPEEIQLRKSCKLHASDKKPYLIPNKYLKNKVSSNNFNVREHAGPSDPKFNLYSKKSSKELDNITMKSRSMGNELYGIDQIMETRFMNVGNMHLGEPSVKSKNSNLSLYASSIAEDKPRNWASMNITEKSTNKLEENDEEKYI